MDIVFDKGVPENPEHTFSFEWMDRNQKGAYSSSTVCGMNIRREHGLFVVPGSDLIKKVVLLAKLEESVFVENRLHEISTNQFLNNIFPRGYKYLKKFSLTPFPKSVFKIEDRIIHRTLFWLSDKNILAVRYELKNQGRPVKLIIKPFITARYNQSLTDEIQGINTDSYLSQNSVRWGPRLYMPQLHAYFLSGSYNTATLWYHKFYYKKDVNRYSEQQEDLLNPGFFEVGLRPYEVFDLFFSTEDLIETDLDYEAMHRSELYHRGFGITITQNGEEPAAHFRNHLRLSHIDYDGKLYPAVSSINPTKNLRHILFAMPGMYLAEKSYADFKFHYIKIAENLNGGLLPVQYPKLGGPTTYASADLSLWYMDLGFKYYRETGDISFFEGLLLEAYRSIIDNYSKGTRFNIYKDSDSLLFAGDRKNNVSWQYGAKENNSGARYGKLLEINALWYNAIRILSEISKGLGKNRYYNKYRKLSEKVNKSFNKVFEYDDAGFYDFVRSDIQDREFTLNQLIPLCLTFRCCDDNTALKVLEKIESELLTPYGIRIAAKSTDKQANRKKDYIKRLIKTSVISMYIQARMYYKPVSHETLQYFTPLINLAEQGLLGFIPEYVTTDENHFQVGIQDYTPSLSDWIWVEYMFAQQK
ncbi:MAG: glycogen debranching enzyme N-terminal domain-containing protein [Calditrichaceae bacterium]